MNHELPTMQSWVSMADLLRIEGVDGQYAELLYFSGIHSVQQLAVFNVHNLTKKMVKTNEKEHRIKEAPSEKQVTGWVNKAKKIDPIIEF